MINKNEKSELKEEIKNFLRNKLKSRLIYTVFIFGSEEGKYFRIKDLKELFYPMVKGNSTISNNVKKLYGLFFENVEKSDNLVYCYSGFDFEGVGKEDYKIDSRYKIKWERIEKFSGKPIIPSFKWLEVLYDIKIDKNKRDLLLAFYRSYMYHGERINFDVSDFPGYDFDFNILNLLVSHLDTCFFLDCIGKLIFKDNFYSARKDFNRCLSDSFENCISANNINAYDPLSFVCNKYNVDLKYYDSTLIFLLLFENDFIERDEFKYMWTVVNKKNLDDNDRKKDIHKEFLTIKDILLYSFR